MSVRMLLIYVFEVSEYFRKLLKEKTSFNLCVASAPYRLFSTRMLSVLSKVIASPQNAAKV